MNSARRGATHAEDRNADDQRFTPAPCPAGYLPSALNVHIRSIAMDQLCRCRRPGFGRMKYLAHFENHPQPSHSLRKDGQQDHDERDGLQNLLGSS